MYCEYYGFAEEPFDITPDPSFLFLTPGHEEILTSIVYGIQSRRVLMAIIGEVGTGKTTILNTALEWLSKKTKVAYVINFDVSFDDLLAMALVKLGLLTADQTITKIDALNRLDEFAQQQLADGGNVAFIVDEAQNLNRRAMENLRLLSNLETPKHKLVQIVLSGQPELAAKLDQPEVRQLTQRISIRRNIDPLREDETYKYMHHRMEVAGYNGPLLFSQNADRTIWRNTQGIPRKINILCDNSLLIGFRKHQKKIHTPIVEKALKELRWSKPEGR
jgi:general secretion pathway protein A